VRSSCNEPERGPAFADTQPCDVTKNCASGNDPLRLFRCGCESSRLARIRRKSWMRLLPYFRLYKCRECGSRVLRPRIQVDSYVVHGYLPAFYRRSAPIQRLQPTAPVVQVVLESGFARQLLMVGATLRTPEHHAQFAETRPL
jgi:hypothetical protein